MNKFIALSTFCLSVSQLQAQTAPRLLPFQGRLTDQNGGAVSNGARLVQFKIYDVPTGGSPVWAGELHRTTVNGGLVNVMLGTKTPFTSIDFDKQLYLEITVDVSGPTGQPDNSITLADPPMLPRQAILPVIFAKESADSRSLDGYDWSALFGTNNPIDGKLAGSRIANNSISTPQIATGAVTSQLLAPGVATLPGTIVAYGGENPPPAGSGWMLCNGAVIRTNDFPGLFAAIGTLWGAGTNSASFKVPDLQGFFLRGSDRGQGRDPDVTNRYALNAGGAAGTASGSTVGSYQTDNFASHKHEWTGTDNAAGGGGPVYAGFALAPGYNGISSTSSQDSPQFRILNSGGAETRPKNACVNYIIKY